MDTIFRVATGVYVPTNSTVIIHVTGGLTLHPITEKGYGSEGGIIQGSVSLGGRVAPPMGLGGIYGWPGLTGNAFNVTLYFGNAANGPPIHSDPTDSLAAISDTLHVGDGYLLQASRNGLNSYYSCTSSHGTQPPAPMQCLAAGNLQYSFAPIESYTMSGVQHLSVERLPDDVTLSAVSSVGQAGRSVSFVPHVNAPGSWGILTWTWTADAGTAQTAACSGQPTTCVTNVYESGTMDVSVYLYSSGKTRHAQVHVSAVNCPTGDSLLDGRSVRDSIKAVINRSYNVDSLKVLELSGFIMRNKRGAYYFLPDLGATGTDCSVDPGDLSTVPRDPETGQLALAHVHTHPTYPWHHARGCVDLAGNPYNQWMQTNSDDNGGGSDGDWTVVDSVLHMPEYVVAINGRISRLDPGYAGSHHKKDNPNYWWWKDSKKWSGCEW